jgi:hypothetical protein
MTSGRENDEWKLDRQTAYRGPERILDLERTCLPSRHGTYPRPTPRPPLPWVAHLFEEQVLGGNRTAVRSRNEANGGPKMQGFHTYFTLPWTWILKLEGWRWWTYHFLILLIFTAWTRCLGRIVRAERFYGRIESELLAKKHPFPNVFDRAGVGGRQLTVHWSSIRAIERSQILIFFDFRKLFLRPSYMIYHCKINRNHVRLAQVLFTKMLLFRLDFVKYCSTGMSVPVSWQNVPFHSGVMAKCVTVEHGFYCSLQNSSSKKNRFSKSGWSWFQL